MSETKIDFLYLNEEDMIKAGVMDMKGCVEALDEMFRLMKIGDYRMGGANGNSHGVMMVFPDAPEFPNMPKNGPDRRFMAMPAYLGGKFDMVGMKWYGSNVENKKKGLPRSVLMLTLNDKDTGAPIAYMSANILSAYRTGAVPGVGYKYFAREDAGTVGIIGPGVMGKTAFEAAMAVRPGIETVKVKGSSAMSASSLSFKAFVEERYPSVRNIVLVDTNEEAVRDCDIVSIAPSVPTGDPAFYPFVEESWIKPGAVISCAAAARFDDEFLIHRARNVADNIMLYEAWAEEMPYPAYNSIPMPAVHCMDLIHDGKMTLDQIDDLGDAMMGKIPLHRKKDEIVIYSVGGMPIEDVAWGTVVYRNALEKGIGTTLNLWDVPALR